MTSFPGRGDKLFGQKAADNGDDNPCHNTKPTVLKNDDGSLIADLTNTACRDEDGMVVVPEQAGANVTSGFQGKMALKEVRTPIMDAYYLHGMCPVNVHWHLGAEHLSLGEFDTSGKGPDIEGEEDEDGEVDSRRLAKARRGHRCHHFDDSDARFTTEYDWQHCVTMHVGETYEVHWPHSKGGKCGTPWQYQTPFYDGVFCNAVAATTGYDTDFQPDATKWTTWQNIGVQGQVFTIVND